MKKRKNRLTPHCPDCRKRMAYLYDDYRCCVCGNVYGFRVTEIHCSGYPITKLIKIEKTNGTNEKT
jgi:hypothetical protein